MICTRTSTWYTVQKCDFPTGRGESPNFPAVLLFKFSRRDIRISHHWLFEVTPAIIPPSSGLFAVLAYVLADIGDSGGISTIKFDSCGEAKRPARKVVHDSPPGSKPSFALRCASRLAWLATSGRLHRAGINHRKAITEKAMEMNAAFLVPFRH